MKLVWKVEVDGGLLWSGIWNSRTVHVIYVDSGGDRGIGSALLELKALKSSYGLSLPTGLLIWWKSLAVSSIERSTLGGVFSLDLLNGSCC